MLSARFKHLAASTAAALAVLVPQSGCPSASAVIEGDEEGECSDGVDNDQDSLTDCADEGCAAATACVGDDDDATGDDDDSTTSDDDDSAHGDDDDSTPGDDDDSAHGDDDDSAHGDDDDSGDDDDDSAGDDDDSALADADGDGAPANEDCDDTDPLIYPLAGDVYGDGVDSDCDGQDCAGAGFGDAYFVACTNQLLWAAAQAECQALGYDGLATVVDAGEQSFLEGLRPLPGSVKHWIGLNDVAVEGVYEWVSGLPVAYTHWYTATEPSGQAGTDEDCVHLFETGGPPGSNGFWNDNWCSTTTHGWFCEAR